MSMTFKSQKSPNSMLVYIVKQHTSYEVAIVTAGCFHTEYEIMTAES